MSKQTYKISGFPGTYEEYVEERKIYDRAWGKKKKRVNGRLVWYEQCSKCGIKRKPHYLGGLCRRCFEISRRDYKLEHYHAKHNPNRRNKFQEQPAQVRDTSR